MFDKIKFASRLKSLRKEAELSTRKLGQILGISHAAITQFEKGTSLPSLDTLIAIANYFEVTTDYLLGASDIPFPLSEKVAKIIDQANSPEQLMNIIKEINQSEESSYSELIKLIEGLDEESMQELHKFIKYLQARQTLSPSNDESSAGLEKEG